MSIPDVKGVSIAANSAHALATTAGVSEESRESAAERAREASGQGRGADGKAVLPHWQGTRVDTFA